MLNAEKLKPILFMDQLTDVIFVVGLRCFPRPLLMKTDLDLITRSVFYKDPPNA